MTKVRKLRERIEALEQELQKLQKLQKEVQQLKIEATCEHRYTYTGEKCRAMDVYAVFRCVNCGKEHKSNVERLNAHEKFLIEAVEGSSE